MRISTKSLLTASAFLFLLLGMCSCKEEGVDSIAVIEKNFKDIPESQKLAVYWYWIGGNMSKDGVIKDLQSMKEVGINRVQIGMIGASQGVPQGPVRMFTDEWWDILHTALKTAGELDIEVGLFNCPGWSQSGGPWVETSQAMRYLASSKVVVEGPAKFSESLPQVGEDAQDVKVLAYPYVGSTVGFSLNGNPEELYEIIFTSEEPVTVRSLTITPVKTPASSTAEFFVKQEGKWRSVDRILIDRSNPADHVGFNPYAPVVISLPEIEGSEFKLKMERPGLVENVELSDQPAVERYPEKSLAKMWQTPHPMFDAYEWRDQPSYSVTSIQAEDIQDISSKMSKDGVLTWDVPEGKWVIERTAMLPTGVEDSPAPPEGTGLETDKMSKKHIRAHFDNYLGEILKKIPARDRKTFRIVVEDSYETGGQNWTDDLIPDFKKAYGYDPTPYIPVINGVVVGSPEISDRFLWDLRRLIADQVAYNYVGGLREISHEHGMTTWLENYGHWGFPGEFLQYGGQSDEIAGEFWSFGDLGNIENRIASSCGHIYGKPRVWAESFTCGGPDFTQYPGQMKQRGDRFFTEGINATLLHVYIQQPDDRVPGINANFGNEFNRKNTWYSQMDVFAKYLKRCNYMLQQGRYVADVAYFISEDAPKMNGEMVPALPYGYSFDYINAEVLLASDVEDGKLILPSGMVYSVLVLPQVKTMRPELLAHLQKLVDKGLVMLGPEPERSPSLEGYPESDEKVREMAAKMWQSGSGARMVRYGDGRIYNNADLEYVLSDIGVKPDFSIGDPSIPVQFIHLTLEDAEIYFLSNQSDRKIAFDGIFNVSCEAPELWNPLTCETRLLPQFETVERGIKLPLEFDAFESSFIVFRKDAAAAAEGKNYPSGKLLASVTAPWKVDFQEGRGGPEGTVTLDSLSDWTLSASPAIKYFSGTATYSNTFNLNSLPQSPVYIDLGRVMVMAKVKINGEYAGGVWTAPYRLNVTDLLKEGENSLEVEVVNCWRNRIIGEMSMPESERFTFQTKTYLDASSELQSSGLLGPVEIRTYDYQLK